MIDALDTRLLDSPLGWAGHRVMGTLWFAAGSSLPLARRKTLLVLRVLAPRVEPAVALLTRVWAAWRHEAWQLVATPPRVSRT